MMTLMEVKCLTLYFWKFQTRMQSLVPTPGGEYRGVMNTLTQMVRTEGVFRPVRGMSAVMIGAGPAHALYFSCYERIKEILATHTAAAGFNNLIYGELPNINCTINVTLLLIPCINITTVFPISGAAGCLATLFHDGIMTPADGKIKFIINIITF